MRNERRGTKLHTQNRVDTCTLQNKLGERARVACISSKAVRLVCGANEWYLRLPKLN